jgi:hypothetical protein
MSGIEVNITSKALSKKDTNGKKKKVNINISSVGLTKQENKNAIRLIDKCIKNKDRGVRKEAKKVTTGKATKGKTAKAVTAKAVKSTVKAGKATPSAKMGKATIIKTTPAKTSKATVVKAPKAKVATKSKLVNAGKATAKEDADIPRKLTAAEKKARGPRKLTAAQQKRIDIVKSVKAAAKKAGPAKSKKTDPSTDANIRKVAIKNLLGYVILVEKNAPKNYTVKILEFQDGASKVIDEDEYTKRPTDAELKNDYIAYINGVVDDKNFDEGHDEEDDYEAYEIADLWIRRIDLTKKKK